MQFNFNPVIPGVSVKQHLFYPLLRALNHNKFQIKNYKYTVLHNCVNHGRVYHSLLVDLEAFLVQTVSFTYNNSSLYNSFQTSLYSLINTQYKSHFQGCADSEIRQREVG